MPMICAYCKKELPENDFEELDITIGNVPCTVRLHEDCLEKLVSDHLTEEISPKLTTQTVPTPNGTWIPRTVKDLPTNNYSITSCSSTEGDE